MTPLKLRLYGAGQKCLLLLLLSLRKIYAAHVSYAVDDAHRPPLHGAAVAARAARGTCRQTDGHTQLRFNRPTLKYMRAAY